MTIKPAQVDDSRQIAEEAAIQSHIDTRWAAIKSEMTALHEMQVSLEKRRFERRRSAFKKPALLSAIQFHDSGPRKPKSELTGTLRDAIQFRGDK